MTVVYSVRRLRAATLSERTAVLLIQLLGDLNNNPILRTNSLPGPTHGVSVDREILLSWFVNLIIQKFRSRLLVRAIMLKLCKEVDCPSTSSEAGS